MMLFFRILLVISISTTFLMAGYDDGMIMFKRGDYEQAITFFQEFAEQAPDQYQGYQMLGYCYLKLKQNDKALQNLKKANNLNSGDASLALALSNLYQKKKDYKNAGQTLKRVNAASIQNAELKFKVYYQRGLAYYQSSSHASAIKNFSQALKVKKDSSASYYAGLSCYQSGRYGNAAAYLKTAIDGGVKKKRAPYWYVQALNQGARKLNGDAKVAAYRKASVEAKKLALSGASYDTILLAGETLLGAKIYDEALEHFRKARAKNPEDGYSYFYTGKTLSLMGKYEDSQKELTKSLKHLPAKNRKNALEQIAYNHHKLNQFDEAIKVYEQLGDQKKVSFEKDAKSKFQNNIKAEKEREEYERKVAERDKKDQSS